MKGLLKFGIKVGILGGSIHYSRQIGVWDDSSRTYEVAREAMNYAKPYFKTAVDTLQTQYPTVQELPTVADMNRSAATCWNKGVIKSVDFLTNLPCTLKKYIGEGTAYVKSQLQQEQNASRPVSEGSRNS